MSTQNQIIKENVDTAIAHIVSENLNAEAALQYIASLPGDVYNTYALIPCLELAASNSISSVIPFCEIDDCRLQSIDKIICETDACGSYINVAWRDRSSEPMACACIYSRGINIRDGLNCGSLWLIVSSGYYL